jgi:hypothetical protein
MSVATAVALACGKRDLMILMAMQPVPVGNVRNDSAPNLHDK